MVRIELAALRKGAQWLELTPTAEALELDPQLFEDIRVKLLLTYEEGRLLVQLWVGATATLECDRTLELFKQPIEGAYSLFYGSSGMTGRREDVEEIRALRASDRFVDLTDVVRDTLLLAIPMRRVKPGAESIPIPMQFGVTEESQSQDASIDPRWQALKKLRDF